MRFASALDPALRGRGLRQTTLARELPIPGENLTLIGHSRAADSTAFFVPELRLALDAGPGSPVHPQWPAMVLITHQHSDHSYGITSLITRRIRPRVCVPRSTAATLEDYIVASHLLNHGSDSALKREDFVSNQIITPVSPGDIVSMDEHPNLEIEVVDCHHSCDAVGYVLFRTKDVLRDELKGLPGAELKRLRTESEEPITRRVRKPLFAFMADTTPAALQNAIWLRSLPVLIIECTFIKDSHRENAERTKHTLWSDLVPIIKAHPETTFILTHFSHQYTEQGIISFFKGLDDPPPNIVIWLQDDEDK
ncbi:beta-lactamase-like protein [Auriculariales sp. MPI-PUGE-AT-0066]|nr:beta-lactamase-like protein [Auriculariales sp. MPI-PUGE-AT-0066]